MAATPGGSPIQSSKDAPEAHAMSGMALNTCPPSKPDPSSWPCPLASAIYSRSSRLQTPSIAASQTKALQARLRALHFLAREKKEKKEPTMVSAKRIAQLTKKWQRMEALGRKRLTWGTEKQADECCTSVAAKGHCVVYTSDERRFEVPLAYLDTRVFAELLQMAQEEFGFTSEGRITLPCDATAMEYAMCLLRRGASLEVEKAFLSTMAVPCHYTNSAAPSVVVSQQLAVCSF